MSKQQQEHMQDQDMGTALAVQDQTAHLPATVQAQAVALIEQGWDLDGLGEQDVRDLAAAVGVELQATRDATMPRVRDVMIEVLQNKALFQFPGSDTAVESFDGVILGAHTGAAWYEHKYTEGSNQQPDCASTDGIHGSRPAETRTVNGRQVQCFGKCAECWFNSFGSNRDGRQGKDCHQYKRLIVKVPGYELPMIVRASAVSIRDVEGYLTAVLNRGKPVTALRTRFRLHQEKATDTYSVLRLGPAGDWKEAMLPVKEFLAMRELKDTETYRHLVDLQVAGPEDGEPSENGAASGAAGGVGMATDGYDDLPEDEVPF